MNEKSRQIFFITISLILLITSYINFISLDDYDIITKIFGWIASYLCLYLSLIILLSKFKHRYIKNLLNILSIPMLIIKIAQYYIAPIVTIVMFVAFYIVPTILVLRISEDFISLLPYLDGIIYLVNVIAVLFFAYLGNSVMKIIMNTFQISILKNRFNKYSTVFYTRSYSYALMIIIYVTYNFITFSEIKLYAFLIEYVSVIKEVFVTFIAIDSLIQIILIRKKRNNEKEKTFLKN